MARPYDAMPSVPLRAPGAILLVSCYELGHQPLGIAWPAAFLERAGYAPRCLDLAVEPLDEAVVRRASFVAISVPMHTALVLGVRAARRIRQLNPDCHVSCFGLYAELNRDFLLREVADSVLAGECEEALVRLIGDLETRPAGPVLERLAFPVPSRDGLAPLTRYVRLARGGGGGGGLVPAGYVEASRGCLHECLHCPIPAVYGGRFFVVPHDVVLADIRRLVAAGAGHITFGDPDFLNGPGHSLRLARALHAEFPDVTYDFTAKIEHILERRRLFPQFAATGCLFVVSAVESLSDVVLQNLEKGHTRADVREALGILRDAGIALRPSLLPFTPWATLDDYLELLDFVDGEDLVDHVDPVQYTIRLLVPPGSRLLAQPAMQPFLGPLDPAGFSYRWTHPDPRMDELQREVSALVERAAQSGRDVFATFHDVRALAAAAAGRSAPARPTVPPPERPIPARLTEPWFC